MRSVLTLITAGPNHRLAGIVAAVRDAIRAAAQPVWLAMAEACDIFIEADEPEAIEDAVRAVIGDLPVDLVLQPQHLRRRRLLVADLESTIIANEMLDELGAMRGIGGRITEITRAAMNGEIDFAAALAARVALLAGTDTRILAEAAGRLRLNPGAQTLVATMRQDGAATALVTGGFTVFAEPIAVRLGFDRVIANRLAIAGDRLTGDVVPPIVTGETKRRTLLALANELGIAPAATVAVGDGANDLPMLSAAGLGIAYHAKPAVAERTRTRLNHADLTGLLYAQGYAKTQFVPADPPQL